MISDVPTANDGDGRDADASDPGDWITAAEANDQNGEFYQCTEQDPDTGEYVSEPSSWHGTQTSGLIAALTDNGVGMASVGRTVRVLPVRVLGKCGGFDSDIIAGMRWAAGMPVTGVPANTRPARILNMSFGADGDCTAAYQDVVAQLTTAGVLMVAAAGNSNGHAVGTPANCPGVIAVGGLRHIGTKVGYSTVGLETIISAPAGNCVNTDPSSPCLFPILSTSNSGATTPQSSIYTDSFNVTLGTSFSAPLVAGTAALMFSARPALTPNQVKLMLQGAATPFPVNTTPNPDGSLVPQCTQPQYDADGNPIDQLECNCTIDACGAGMLNAGAAVRAASAGPSPYGIQAEGLWWNAPGASESGWGLNIAQQGSVIFATWFTYDANGNAWWLSMTANRASTDPDTYTGQLVQTSGPAFSAVPFDPAKVTRNVVGAATLTFTDLNRATFDYTVNGIEQVKTITRQVFGALPACTYSSSPSFSGVTNFQDLWWVPNGAESGWGVNVIHQSDTIFATWFTYDANGAPLWLSVTASKTGSATYTGDLVRTAGPPFFADPFDPTLVSRSVVGNAMFTFSGGNAGTFAYTVNGTSQTKSITRQLFAPPAATVCQ
jgi:hypothetical protein